MTKDQPAQNDSQIELALGLARRALAVCDDQGLMFAAIHLCQAVEALEQAQKASANAL